MHKYVLRSDIMYNSNVKAEVKIEDEKQGVDRDTQETESE